jgi:hypothetical protein
MHTTLLLLTSSTHKYHDAANIDKQLEQMQTMLNAGNADAYNAAVLKPHGNDKIPYVQSPENSWFQMIAKPHARAMQKPCKNCLLENCIRVDTLPAWQVCHE